MWRIVYFLRKKKLSDTADSFLKLVATKVKYMNWNMWVIRHKFIIPSLSVTSYLRSQGRRSQLTDDAGQQSTGVRDQVGGKELMFSPQTVPDRKHDNNQHFLQNFSEAGHPWDVLFTLLHMKRKFQGIASCSYKDNSVFPHGTPKFRWDSKSSVANLPSLFGATFTLYWSTTHYKVTAPDFAQSQYFLTEKYYCHLWSLLYRTWLQL